MAHLPFRTGLLSTMDDHEMLGLADDLEHSSYWRSEQHIADSVDRYIANCWRRSAQAPFIFHAASYTPWTDSVEPTFTVHATYKDIHVRVPDTLDERTARLFAEIQIREQMHPGFDPTED